MPFLFFCVTSLFGFVLELVSSFFLFSFGVIPTDFSQFDTNSHRFFHMFSKKPFHAVLAKTDINSLVSLSDCIRSCNADFAFFCIRPLTILIWLSAFSSSEFPYQILLSSSLFILFQVSSESVIQARLVAVFSVFSQPLW